MSLAYNVENSLQLSFLELNFSLFLYTDLQKVNVDILGCQIQRNDGGEFLKWLCDMILRTLCDWAFCSTILAYSYYLIRRERGITRLSNWKELCRQTS